MTKKKIVVLGSGLSGIGAAILAKKKGYDVFVSDLRKISKKNKIVLDNNKIDYEELQHSECNIKNANEVVKSPGISPKEKIIKYIEQKNIPIISEVEFAFRFTKAKIVAITGTNGKTTTTLLLGHILKKNGYDVLVAGNIGVSFSLAISKKDYDYIVLEISSYQLDGISAFKSDISILLNITPDHLDRYENFQSYIYSKYRITQNQTKADYLIYNSDDPLVSKISTDATKLPISLISKQKNGAYLNNNKLIININNKTMTIQELALQGRHNIFNSMAAAVASRIFEVDDSVIRQSMIDFKNIEHRLEHVLTVHGIDFINDSKATNVNATWFALESMNKDVVWIVGGVDKGNDYSQLEEIVLQKVKIIVCLGQNNDNIIKTFRGKIDTIVQANSMVEAVNHSFSLANKSQTVLLSPSCASFDLFKNYEDRGLQFKKAVRAL